MLLVVSELLNKQIVPSRDQSALELHQNADDKIATRFPSDCDGVHNSRDGAGMAWWKIAAESAQKAPDLGGVAVRRTESRARAPLRTFLERTGMKSWQNLLSNIGRGVVCHLARLMLSALQRSEQYTSP